MHNIKEIENIFMELEKIANETISYVNSTKLENFKEWNE